jgi:pimeloyl-ACP methyl ester carboxylesterase
MNFRILLFIFLFASVHAQNGYEADGLWWVYQNDTSQKYLNDASIPKTFDFENENIVIEFHGFCLGCLGKDLMHSTYSDSITEGLVSGEYFVNYWLDKGFNFGQFRWNHYADEFLPYISESKIYTPHGPKGMRAKNDNGGYTDITPWTGQSVADRAVEEISNFLKALRVTKPEYDWNELRFLGYGLGAQLALEVAKKLPDEFLPTRLVLLDSFFSNDPQSYLHGIPTDEQGLLNGVALLGKGVLLEAYKTSEFSWIPYFTSINWKLMRKTLFFEIFPQYVGGIIDRHTIVRGLYLYSMKHEAPYEVKYESFFRRNHIKYTDRQIGYASMTDDFVRNVNECNWDDPSNRNVCSVRWLLQDFYLFIDREFGAKTFEVTDDNFLQVRWLLTD